MMQHDTRIHVLFVFAWLVVGGEETEVRLLARALPRDRYRIDVVACFRKEGMPEQTHEQLRDLGVDVDTTPYGLSFEDTVGYLADKVARYDVIVSCQNVADIYPALERLASHPPLIEHGGLVSEALAGPKHRTARYVGVCTTIRDAAASRMPGRERDAVMIPSMVDLEEFAGLDRAAERRALWRAAFPDQALEDRAQAGLLFGWLGRLDPKKNVDQFIDAAARVAAARPQARFVVIGGADAFLPDYARDLQAQAARLGLQGRLAFLGDRRDVPALLTALDALVWLSRDEGMPHVIAEAGAAGLPVIATPDNGALEQIIDGKTGLLTPYDDPGAVAARMIRLADDAGLRARLGAALRARVEREFSLAAVVPRWKALIDGVLAERDPAPVPALFRSFRQGGFECSTHRLRGDGHGPGRRLDVIAAIGHDRFAAEDYRQLAAHGIRTVRDGFRWHLIERAPGRYDWSSIRPMLEAAERTGTQVIWDLMHYGWPDDIDIWRPAFVERFAAYARAAAHLVRETSSGVPFWCPVNEISFLAWGGGDVGYLNPFGHGRGFELKVQLARAAIRAMEEIRAVDPRARFVHCDPVIHIAATRQEDRAGAEGHRLAQYQGWDMIAGRIWPQLGGRAEFLDIVGVNYYPNNQWLHGGPPLRPGHPLHRPLHLLLAEVHARYGRPILVAETGTEDDARGGWLVHVAAEVALARARGLPVEGICLYPVADHPGWDDDRDCRNGLLTARRNAQGLRDVHEPLAEVLSRLPDGQDAPRAVARAPH